MGCTDIFAESPVQEPMQIYVPRDDAMERCKKEDFEVGRQKGMRRNFVPYLASIADRDAFERFSDINGLYKKRPSLEMKSPLAKIIETVQDYIEPYKFDPPMTISSKHQFNSFLCFIYLDLINDFKIINMGLILR